MLQIFPIVREAIPPTLGTEGPQLCVAEDEEEYTANQKTDRPCKARPSSVLAKGGFGKKEQTSKDYQKPGQMVVLLTLLFVPDGNGLL